MARYNKIYAGPATEATPQVVEGIAAAATLPGCLVVWSSGDLALAGAATLGKMFVAQDNYLALKGVDDAWAQNDRMIAMEMLDNQFFNVRVATGNNVTKGAALTPAANGLLAIASTGDKVVAYAEEDYNNTSGTSQLVRVRCSQTYMTA